MSTKSKRKCNLHVACSDKTDFISIPEERAERFCRCQISGDYSSGDASCMMTINWISFPFEAVDFWKNLPYMTKQLIY